MSGIRKGANFKASDLPSHAGREAVSLVAEDGGASRGILYTPAGKVTKVGVHLMHPNTDQSQNYNIPPLVKAGYTVLGRGGRWVNNDVASIQEKLMLDIAAGVKLLRERGCEQVVLLGSARGGPLAALYQREARRSPPHRLTDTAAGDPFDLNQYDLPPADAIALIGPHMGGAYSLLKWIDPSVTDESDPVAGDASLDMYDPANGFRIPPQPSHYATEFLTRYRAAQAARVQRLDKIARSRIARRREAARQAKELAAAGRNGAELRRLQRIAAMPDHLRIYRMVADPAFCDPTIEPDDRDVCSFENDPRPDLMNDGPGYAHFLKPEAFLSTWSEFSTRTRTAECLRDVPDPLVVVHYAGDGGTRIGEARQMFDASPSKNKEFVLVRNADHYGFRILGPHQRGDRVAEGTDAIVAWMKAHFPC